jgi:hypothetical protein
MLMCSRRGALGDAEYTDIHQQYLPKILADLRKHNALDPYTQYATRSHR